MTQINAYDFLIYNIVISNYLFNISYFINKLSNI